MLLSPEACAAPFLLKPSDRCNVRTPHRLARPARANSLRKTSIDRLPPRWATTLSDEPPFPSPGDVDVVPEFGASIAERQVRCVPELRVIGELADQGFLDGANLVDVVAPVEDHQVGTVEIVEMPLTAGVGVAGTSDVDFSGTKCDALDLVPETVDEVAPAVVAVKMTGPNRVVAPSTFAAPGRHGGRLTMRFAYFFTELGESADRAACTTEAVRRDACESPDDRRARRGH